MDWNAIKIEYITTDTSYRKLAEKYDISFGTLQKRATKESWSDLRSQFVDKTVTKTVSKISARQVDRAARLQSVTDKLLNKAEMAIDDMDGDRCGKSIKDISDALKNIKDIMMIKSDGDLREQEARIAKLRKESVDEDAGKEVTVRIMGGDDSWQK